MRSTCTFLIVAAAVALAVTIGGFFSTRTTPDDREKTAAAEEAAAALAMPHDATQTPTPEPRAPALLVARPDETAPAQPPALAATPGAPSWDPQVQAATAAGDGWSRARALFELLPRVPQEAAAEVVGRAVDDLPDEAYVEVAQPVLLNADTPGYVLSVLFADLMERPDAITLNALLQIARNRDHPYAPSALDNLRLLLKTDRGTDWPAWQAEVQRKLAPTR